MFRVYGKAKGEAAAIEMEEVFLKFDEETLKAFAELVSKSAEDFDAFCERGHAHIRDNLHPREYFQQQKGLVSRDILLFPLRPAEPKE
ncbi:MAG: hypothetical protein AAFU49_09825 [Pseudomonadota bacterium]